MKKILLTTAAVAAISSSAFADMENSFYLRGDVGGAYFTKLYSNSKAKTAFDIDAGFGYNVMDNVRVELIYDKPFIGSMKIIGSNYTGKVKPTINAVFARVHADVADLGMGKFFLSGGLGWSQVKDSITRTDGVAYKYKAQNNVAWTIGAGFAFDVAESTHLEIAYNFKDYGKPSGADAVYRSTSTVRNVTLLHTSHNLSAGIRFDI